MNKRPPTTCLLSYSSRDHLGETEKVEGALEPGNPSPGTSEQETYWKVTKYRVTLGGQGHWWGCAIHWIIQGTSQMNKEGAEVWRTVGYREVSREAAVGRFRQDDT